MPRLIRKAHKLVFNAGTIPRTDAFDFTAIHGGLMKVIPNDLGGFRRRMGHPARDLGFAWGPALAPFAGMFHVEHIPGIARIVKRKQGRQGLTFLFLHLGEIKTAA